MQRLLLGLDTAAGPASSSRLHFNVPACGAIRQITGLLGVQGSTALQGMGLRTTSSWEAWTLGISLWKQSHQVRPSLQ